MSDSLDQSRGPREVQGPSALGGGRRRFFDLLWLMAVTEFKRTYFGTVLGYLWSLIRPLMLFGVLLFVFTKILRIGSETPTLSGAAAARHRPLLVLPGSDAELGHLRRGAGGRGPQDPVPAPGDPALHRPHRAFNLGLNLVIVFIFILAWGVDPAWTWLLFPFALLLIFVFTAAVSMVLSVLYVRFRDIAIIWTVFAQVLFYATPVLYPLDVVPASYPESDADQSRWRRSSPKSSTG